VVAIFAAEIAPALARQLGEVAEPARIVLRAAVAGDELLALDAGLLAEAQELAFETDQLAVEDVDLLDELLDAAVVELDRAHMPAQLGGELDDLALGLGRGLHALVRRLQPLVQQLVDLLESDGDLVESLDHAGQELLLHGGER